MSIAPPAAKAVRSGEMRPAWPSSITARACWRAEVPPISSAARGELRRGLPVGLIWGETDGEIRFHPG